jgi:hypothetical protein
MPSRFEKNERGAFASRRFGQVFALREGDWTDEASRPRSASSDSENPLGSPRRGSSRSASARTLGDSLNLGDRVILRLSG